MIITLDESTPDALRTAIWNSGTAVRYIADGKARRMVKGAGMKAIWEWLVGKLDILARGGGSFAARTHPERSRRQVRC